jgi:hypothetical protein
MIAYDAASRINGCQEAVRMHKARIIIGALAVALALSAATGASGAQSVLATRGGAHKAHAARVKKDEWCRSESCPANPPCVFKTNAKKETWDLKCSGTVVIEGKKQKYKEVRSGTYVISDETYTFTETEGSIDGNPSRYGLVLKGVKTATGFNSPEHPGTYTLSAVPELGEEGWWTENN